MGSLDSGPRAPVRRREPDMQNQLYQLQRFFRVTMKKPVIAHPSEAPGEDMLHNEL